MTVSRTFYFDGQLVEADDIDNDGYQVGTLTGAAIAAFVGDTEVRPSTNAMTVVPGTGLNVVVGGNNQTIAIRDSNGALQLADYLPATTLPFAANTSGQTRIDLVVGVYDEVANGTFLRDFLTEEGQEIPDGITAHYVGRSVTWSVVEGTPGSPAPAAPSGTYPIAHIQILDGATTLGTGNINVVVPTIGQALQNSGASINPTLVSQDGYMAFAQNATESVIGLTEPYPTLYSSPDGSIDVQLLNDSPPTQPVLPGNPITMQLKVNLNALSSSGSIGSSGTIPFNAGTVFFRRRSNTGSAIATLEPGTPLYPYGSTYVGAPAAGDTSFSPNGSFLGGLSLSSVTGGNNTLQAEFLLSVTPGAGAVTVGGSVNSSTSFTGGSGQTTVFLDNNPATVSSGGGIINWSATIPDDGNEHILVFHVNDTHQIFSEWTAWIPATSSGGVNHALIASVGPT